MRFGRALGALALAVVTGCTSSPPQPLPDRPVPGHHLPACPHHVPGAPHNSTAPGDELVWPGPTLGEVCRYYPTGGLAGRGVPHGTLYGHTLVTTARTRRLAAILDRMPSVARSERIACPIAFGTHDLLLFGYADGRSLEVLATPEGCPSFTNGRFTTGDFSHAYVHYLELVDRLVPPKKQKRLRAAGTSAG